MKVLILSCHTGEGHNSAARALADALEERGIEYEIVDPVSFGGKKTSRNVSAAYNNIIKFVPVLFGLIYGIGAAYEASRLPSPIYWANSLYADKLNDYVKENGFDCVVCTHLYGMEAMTYLKRKAKTNVPVYGILTDYTAIPFMRDTDLDGYFVGTEDVKEEMKRKKFDVEKIFVTGIPVRAKFCESTEKSEARRLLSLPEEKKIVLVMSGGVGCGNLHSLCKEIEKRTDETYLFLVMTGNNEKLKERIDRDFADGGKIRTLSFTKDVPLYMNAADVVVSKSGGLTTTEAAVANVPLVHLKAIPGCETKNAAIFEKYGMSRPTRNKKQAVYFAKSLAEDNDAAEKMRQAQREYVPRFAARTIVEKITEVGNNE